MLTRAEAAKRIGKSVATIRRLEGVELFPRVDDRGWHLFDEEEVDQLADEIADGMRLPCGMDEEEPPTRLSERIQELEEKVETLCELVELLASR